MSRDTDLVDKDISRVRLRELYLKLDSSIKNLHEYFHVLMFLNQKYYALLPIFSCEQIDDEAEEAGFEGNMSKYLLLVFVDNEIQVTMRELLDMIRSIHFTRKALSILRSDIDKAEMKPVPQSATESLFSLLSTASKQQVGISSSGLNASEPGKNPHE